MNDFAKILLSNPDLETAEGRVEFNSANSELIRRIRYDRNRKEAMTYICKCINMEFGGKTEEDAWNHWEDYKKSHGIEM